MTRLRWVLDTNVVLSALVFPTGRITWLRDAWRTGAITPLVSRETATELIRVLCYPKFRLAATAREDLLADYIAYAEAVVVSGEPSVPECRDPCDRPFLELALFARADALVTGDKDLLALSHDFSVPVISPEAAKALLQRDTSG